MRNRDDSAVREAELLSPKVSRIGGFGIDAILARIPREICITIGEPFYPAERDNENSFCV